MSLELFSQIELNDLLFARLQEAVTQVQGISWVFRITFLIYSILIVGTTVVLRYLAQIPIKQEKNYGA